MGNYIEQLIIHQTEFDEWVENGCNKAKELIEKPRITSKYQI